MNRGFNTAISGLTAARTGLAVTGHNMSNTSTVGFTRQQALQHDFIYQGIGNNLQVGLGNDVTMIRQIRDKYLDMSYRAEVGRVAFHGAVYQTGNEIENIYGELESQYSTQSITQDMWDAINELTMHPSGTETRSNFLSTVVSYITKMNNIQERLVNEQMNLNNDMKEVVTKINQLTTRINELNGKIPLMEASGQRANDYRDDRNLCLDELSRLLKIEYSENSKGEVVVTTGGTELVAHGYAQQIGFRYTGPQSSLVEPVFTTSSKILDFDPTYQNAKPVFEYNQVGAQYGNDSGELFGLLIARGLYPTNYQSLNGYDFAGKTINLGTGDLPVIPNNGGTAPPLPIAPTLTWPNPASYVTGTYPNGIENPAYIAAYETYLNDINDYVAEVEDYLKAHGPDGDNTMLEVDYAAGLDNLIKFKQDVTGGTSEVSLAELNSQFNTFKTYHDCAYLEFNAKECTIPATQREMDKLFNYVVELVNKTLDGTDLYGYTGLPIFTEKIPGKGFTMGNVQVNPDLLGEGGYNRIGLANPNNGIDDGTKATELMELWKTATDIFDPVDGAHKMNIESAYAYVVDNLATTTNRALSFYEAQTDLVSEIDNKRLSISGVSLDEEMKNMMLYQHAFNAASRIVSVIDSMIDKVVNGTGRVGL